MPFDVNSGARLAASILHQYQTGKEHWVFWKTHGPSAEILAQMIGIHPEPGESTESLCARIFEQLDRKREICQKLEMNFPNLPFAPLLQRLAEEVAQHGTKRLHRPHGWAGRLIATFKRKLPKDSAAVRATVARVFGLLESTNSPADGARPIHVEILAVVLFFHPRVATEAALAFDEGLPFPWTQFRERQAISKARTLRNIETSEGDLAKMELVGLAFSGGGIRSATVNLGVLQALAELDLIRYVDYLSTVSGGGYIGSWLHAWFDRQRDPEEVRKALSPDDSPDPESIVTHPIKWLRQYSNYLAPRLGLISADTWSIFTIWLRNWILNIMVIVLALSSVLMVPRGMRIAFELVHNGEPWWPGLLPLIFAVLIIQLNMRSFQQAESRKDRWWLQQKGIHLLVALPVLISAMLMSAWLAESRPGRLTVPQKAAWIAIFMFGLLCIISFFGNYREHFFDRRKRPPAAAWNILQFGIVAMLYNGVAAAAGFVLLILGEQLFARLAGLDALWSDIVWLQLVFGTAAVVMIYALVSILHLGLFGRNLPDDRREWWSRAGAVQSIWLLGWLSVAGMAIYGPWLAMKLVTAGKFGAAMSSVLGSGWIATTVTGVLKGRGDKTGPMSSDPKSDLIARIAPPVFAVGLLLLVSVFVHMATLKLMGIAFPKIPQMMDNHFDYLTWWGPGESWILALLCIATAYLLASRVDVNEFSMHNFYENRLVRCYLGASRRHRVPNRFTGFDPEDDVHVATMHADRDKPYAGPYAIVNTALNLISGEELAWQERKAQSFSFTPLFSGFAASPTEERGGQPKAPGNVSYYGYRPTAEYAFPQGGIRLGKAMAISGAALSPNWGYHTAPATAFLLTVFNVRLGWWIGNPRHRKCWRRSGPGAGLGYLLLELAGAANNKSGYVYLSDGGHFEDLGIYELIRRRCRYIIVCDGGQDPGFTFDDLGNAIRKCRADFGVEIEIDLNSIRPAPADANGARPRSMTHCAVGAILYPPAPCNYESSAPCLDRQARSTKGTLIYVKASLTGDEPADVLEYATLHPEFPHTPTSDQFFDESQFESYRRLGYHIGTGVFEAAASHRASAASRRGLANRPDLQIPAPPLDSSFFSDLRRHWQAASPRTAASFTRHAEVLVALMRRLREDRDLRFFERQINPEWERLMKGTTDAIAPNNFGLPETVAERQAGFHFCNSILQLMEDVYLDLNLEEESEHPDNAGWMNLFDHWSWSAMFRVTWMISASCYGARFRTFCENRLKLNPVSAGHIKIVEAKADDPKLNYREQMMLQEGKFDWDHQRLYLFEIFVTRPDRPEEDMTELTVGLAVVSEHCKLAYFRIQEHLRSMGLAQRMVDAMVLDDECPVDRSPKWHPLPVGFSEPVKPENQERLERMLESAHIRRGTPAKKPIECKEPTK